MKMDPLEQIDIWLHEEINASTARIPTACCLSTIGTDGFPNARFVSLKGIMDKKFIITGPTTSRKGLEIEQNAKVGLTFWWPQTERQVRVQGIALSLPIEMADTFFKERSRESQIVSIISDQGKIMEDVSELEAKYHLIHEERFIQKFPRPSRWGGFRVSPIRVELMEFRSTRLHDRSLYELHDGDWKLFRLQP